VDIGKVIAICIEIYTKIIKTTVIEEEIGDGARGRSGMRCWRYRVIRH
jgi:hypothetical protein